MNTHSALLSLALACIATSALAGDKLSGTPIGTAEGYNYETGRVEQNIQHRAFDGDLDTYFATNARSYTWVGLDLGAPHVIDKVGWAPRAEQGYGPKRVQLAVIQGANREDWLDAVPLYIITEQGTIGRMDYAPVEVRKGFRYVRFVSTADARCNIAELEFYGTPGQGDSEAPGFFQVTNLPTICINTVDAQEPYDKEHDIPANIIVITDGEAFVDYAGTVRERGNASRSFPKKPWRIKFDKKQRVLPDAPAKAKKWTLINNYGDKTLMRNMVAFEIARRLDMKYVPYSHAVDVILNGEYKGCYQLCDQVEVNDGRLEITEMEPEDVAGDALTGGYFIEVDAYADQEPADEWFSSSYHHIPVTIKSPDPGVPEQYNYIKNRFSDLEYRIFDYKFSGDDDYRLVFDIDSFLQHLIVGELAGNPDTYWSTYMYKDRGDDVFHTGPVWDFDIAFDNDSRVYPTHRTAGSTIFLFNQRNVLAANSMKLFANRILYNDARTAADLSRIWSLARNDHGLTYDDMAAYIDAKALELDRSQQLNFLRWPIMNQLVHQNPVISGSYDAEVQRVKDYLRDRFDDLDKLMAYDPTFSALEDVATDDFLKPIVSEGAISFPDDTAFAVYTIDGKCVYRGSRSTPALPAGIYIIKTTDRTFKLPL